MAQNPTFSKSVNPRHNRMNKMNRVIKSKKNPDRIIKPALHSPEFSSLDSTEKKLLNTPSTSEAFLHASNVFGDILNQLTDFDNEEVYERLVQIRTKIEEKISSFNILSPLKGNENLNLSKSVASSMQSLLSETSDLEYFDENDSFKDFLSRVNCPFCLKLEQNKINLIKHMDENCRPLIINEFEESSSLQFSAIQILPNNTFKCNVCNISIKCSIKYFFAHAKSDSHMLAFTKASKSKKYTEFLFCSCCKVLVPNNYTQLNHHINHWVHKLSRKRSPDKLSRNMKKGSNCVYLLSKKFKCLHCQFPSFFISSKDILEHFENASHVNEKKTSNLHTIFCEFCVESIHVFEVLSHFTSEKHQMAEKNHELSKELCSYCNFACCSLTDLSVHMKTQCQEINLLRKQNKILTKVEPNLNKTQEKSDLFKTKIKSNNDESEKKAVLKKAELAPNSEISKKNLVESKLNYKVKVDGKHIIVKGNIKLTELYKHFLAFGEIASMEICEGENVLIQFREKKAVDDVLLLRGVMKIEGQQVEISTVEDSDKSAKEKEKRPEEDKASASGTQTASLDVANKVESPDDDFHGTVMRNPEMDELFSRVSGHLHDSTQKYNDVVMQKVISDCTKVFDVELVGFTACGLSFPVENISFYCKVSELSSEIQSSLNSEHFRQNFIEEFANGFLDRSIWKDINCKYVSHFPFVESTHIITNKSCTFTFMESTKFLTDMLRHCMKKWIVQSFCLIIRFWLSIHELKIREFEYATISLLIFFLLRADVVEPFNMNQKPPPDYVQKFYGLVKGQIEPCEVSISSGRHITQVRELFNKFLYFLLKFDFDKYVICLPLAWPIPKRLLQNYSIRSTLKLNADNLMTSTLCIIDPYLNVNLASGITKKDLKSFLEIVKSNYK